MNSSGAFSCDQLKTELKTLAAEYPSVRVRSIGRSRLGRGIYAVFLGAETPSVLYAGGFHGCEWLTSLCLLKFLGRVSEREEAGGKMCGINVAAALKRCGICVVPCVNPDGAEIAANGASTAGKRRGEVERIMHEHKGIPWSANAAGVDINHNFDAGWEALHEMEIQSGISEPAPTRYGGEYPESEPETRALTGLCRERGFSMAMALHSQGEEIFWRYGEECPRGSRFAAELLSASSGYTLVDGAGLASHGGFKDWFISKLNLPAYTVEIGKGKNPLPVETLDEVYAKIEEMLMLFMLLPNVINPPRRV